MAIMREAGCEWRTIVEGKALATFGEFELSLKGVNLAPEAHNVFFCLRKVDTHLNKLRLSPKTVIYGEGSEFQSVVKI